MVNTFLWSINKNNTLKLTAYSIFLDIIETFRAPIQASRQSIYAKYVHGVFAGIFVWQAKPSALGFLVLVLNSIKAILEHARLRGHVATMCNF
jgi:hypothetical protein